MGYYINPQGGYYEGDRAHALDAEVPRRPTADHTWDGAQWVAPDPAVLLQRNAEREVGAKDRLLFEVLWQQENRLRVLEGKGAVSRAAYRDALITVWKGLAV